MLNRISLFGCIVVCLSSHLLRDLLRTSWLLPCFGNYKESCCQALDNFEVTQESRDRSLFTSGLVGHMSVIRSHFLVSSSVTSYPSAGRVPGTLVPLTAPAPLAPWLRGAESHAILQLCSSSAEPWDVLAVEEKQGLKCMEPMCASVIGYMTL